MVLKFRMASILSKSYGHMPVASSRRIAAGGFLLRHERVEACQWLHEHAPVQHLDGSHPGTHGLDQTYKRFFEPRAKARATGARN
jgi:hypothetical protein